MLLSNFLRGLKGSLYKQTTDKLTAEQIRKELRTIEKLYPDDIPGDVESRYDNLQQELYKLTGEKFNRDVSFITGDKTDYYQMVVELARGENDIKGHREKIKKIAKRILEHHQQPFDEAEFDKYYAEWKKASINRMAFGKS